MQSLDPHQRPPDSIRHVYKKYQKMKLHDLDRDSDILDLSRPLSTSQQAKVLVKGLDLEPVTASFRSFAGHVEPEGPTSPPLAYEHRDMPGLHIVPDLLPPEVQVLLLSRLLHRDLSDPSHLTNIHTHYNISYPQGQASFFSYSPTSSENLASPLDPSVHRPLSIAQLLNKKIRWMTLGGQYDWTEKRYPDSAPPTFPPDIKQLLEGIFPATKAEAAIVNLYSPGDTLSVHRDVAETSGTGLISMSIGCDAIFIIGTSASEPAADGHSDNPEKILTLRLRSGSAVYMSGTSRFAWHGVPQIVPGTCPKYLHNWPGSQNKEEGDSEYEEWRGWMSGKRINLNVRQMWE